MAAKKRTSRVILVAAALLILILVLSAYNTARLMELWDTVKSESDALRRALASESTASRDDSAWKLISGLFPGGETDGDCDLLTLVNPWNSIPEGYEPKLYTLSDGTKVDERCVSDLMDMMDACREAGGSPYICSAYRTQEKQTELFEDKVRRLRESGLSAKEADKKAAAEVARPGTSEHQLGLAMDIIDGSHSELNDSQALNSTQQWLMENSWRYGFILRYPEGKSDVTGIIYEPWHYRYVGRENAADIHASGLCLEEYLKALS